MLYAAAVYGGTSSLRGHYAAAAYKAKSMVAERGIPDISYRRDAHAIVARRPRDCHRNQTTLDYAIPLTATLRDCECS